MLTVGSVFSGIGGLDLGLERAGMRVIWQSEIDPYACRVLAKHWPTVPNLGDITTIDWGTVERPDVICGGYPCQPFSLAGVRRGEGDPRHLWPHFARAIRHLRPRYALLENVPGHLSMGFGAVCGDLAEIGYDVEWCSIPAAAVGAPHLRWRIFAVAYPQCVEVRQQQIPIFGRSDTAAARHDGAQGDVADPEVDAIGTGLRTDGARRIGRRRPRHGSSPRHTWAVEPDVGRVAHGVPNRLHGGGLDGHSSGDTQTRPASAPDDDGVLSVRRDGPTASPPPGLLEADGGSDRLLPLPRIDRPSGRDETPPPTEGLRGVRGNVHDVQPQQGQELLTGMSQRGGATERPQAVGHWDAEPAPRVATGVANRADRLRCLGNAVVPQVAEYIGRMIVQAAAPSELAARDAGQGSLFEETA